MKITTNNATVKKAVSLLLSFLMLTAILFSGVFTASAADIIETGSCGENLTYTLDTDGLLTISGTGDMFDYTGKMVGRMGLDVDISGDGMSPFVNNGAIRKLVIEPGVTSVGKQAFFGCTRLESAEIPEGVKTIGEYAFYNCDALTQVSFPYGLLTIGVNAFTRCGSLKELILPGTMWQILPSSFGSCPGIERLEIYGVDENSYYYSSGNCIIESFIDENDIPFDVLTLGCKNSVIPDDSNLTVIGEDAFYFCEELTDITIPDTVTEIQDFAFAGCSGITNLIIPESVKIIGNVAFGGMGLKTVTVPESVTEIGDSIFTECSELESVSLPDNLSCIPQDMFRLCTSLKEIMIPAGVTSIDPWAFLECPGLEKMEVAAGNTVYHSAGNCIIETATKTLVTGCKNSVIPDDGSVTAIGEFAFAYCSKLTGIDIPNNVTDIGEAAFADCSGLEKIWIPKTVENIVDDAFCGCDKLTIHGVAGSYAERYAEEYEIPFSAERVNTEDEPAENDPAGGDQNESGKGIFDQIFDFIKKILEMIMKVLNIR